MIINKLINPQPKAIIFFIVFAIILFLIPLHQNSYTLLFSSSHIPPALVFLLSLIIIPIHAIGLNNLVYANSVIKKENIIIAFVFVLLNSFYENSLNNLLCSFLMLFVLNYLFETYQKEQPFYQIFNASIIIGLATYLNPKVALFLLLILYTSVVFNHFKWRIFAASIIGFLTPHILHLIIFLVTGKTFYMPESNFTINILSIDDIYQLKTHQIILAIVLTITCLFSIYEFLSWLYKKSIKSRKSFFILIFYVIISLLIIIFFDSQSWYLLITPSTIFIANYFTYSKHRSLANLIFLLLLISSCYYRFMIII